MENSLTVFAVSLFVVTALSTYVSGKAFSDGSMESLKADTIQLAEPTNEPCIYKGRYFTVDLRSIAAQFQ